jgi:hypothetical protein
MGAQKGVDCEGFWLHGLVRTLEQRYFHVCVWMRCTASGKGVKRFLRQSPVAGATRVVRTNIAPSSIAAAGGPDETARSNEGKFSRLWSIGQHCHK